MYTTQTIFNKKINFETFLSAYIKHGKSNIKVYRLSILLLLLKKYQKLKILY